MKDSTVQNIRSIKRFNNPEISQLWKDSIKEKYQEYKKIQY